MAPEDDLPDEVPEADALEQRRAVTDDDGDVAVEVGDSFEVPEADALEQARVVQDDEPDPEG